MTDASPSLAPPESMLPPNAPAPADGFNRTHHLVVAYVGGMSLICWCIADAAFSVFSVERTLPQQWAIFCAIFLIFWWLIYFASKAFRVWTLRRFLDAHSKLRDVAPNCLDDDDFEKWQAMKDKSQSTISTLSILIAVISVFLTFILELESKESNPTKLTYESVMNDAAIFCAIVTIICMVFAIDILDTVSNLYKTTDRRSQSYFARRFYRKLGPGFPSGGISYAYLGIALFSVFIVIALAAFKPWLSGVGVAAYFYLGYPFLFGFCGKDLQDGTCDVEFDQDNMWVRALSIGLAIVFLGVTFLAQYGDSIESLLR